LRIWNLRFQHERAAGFVDRRADAGDAPFVHAGIAFDVDAHRLVHAHQGRVALGHGEAQPQRVHAHDGGDRRAHREVLADRRLALANHAVEWGSEHRVFELLARHVQLAATLEQHGLPIAHVLQRILITAVGDLERRFCIVEVGARRDLTRDEGLDALLVEQRLIEHRPRLPDAGRLFRIDVIVGGIGGQAEPGPRLLQRRFGLVHVQREIGGHELGDRLALADAAAKVDMQQAEPARDFHADCDLLFGGQRAGDRDRPCQPILHGRDHTHRPGLAIAAGARALCRFSGRATTTGLSRKSTGEQAGGQRESCASADEQELNTHSGGGLDGKHC
jgi:hypothetical protein